MPAPRSRHLKPLLITEELLDWLKIGESTLDELIKNDPDFPVEYVGLPGKRKMRRFDEDKIRAWMARDNSAAA